MKRKQWLEIPGTRYRVEADKYQFIVVERYTGKDKDGNPCEQERDIGYYPSLELVLRRIREDLVKDSSTVEEILKALYASYSLDREMLAAVMANRHPRAA